MQKTDVLIIGAGPSGTVAAAIIQKAGFDVTIVEKKKFPRFVIGESLLPKCMEHFEEAGLLEVLKKQKYQEKHGARFIKGKHDCLFDFGQQYTDSWKWTWQVPRADFDKTLADEVAARGVDIQYEMTVSNIEFEGSISTTTVVDKAGQEHHIEAKYIIDASGYGRVIPRLFQLEKETNMPLRKAIFMHFEDHKRPQGEAGKQITFVIHRIDLWVWMIPFSNGVTSVGFVGNPDFFADYTEGTNEEQIRKMIADVPQIKDRFEGAVGTLDTHKMQAFATASTKLFGDGFVITGNSSEFIDPVFSSGVTFATESGITAAKLVCQHLKGETVDWQKEYVEHMQEGMNVFKTYVKAWYDGSLQDIFFYEKVNTDMKRQICSVLAGFVWDRSNPFVKKHQRALRSLHNVIHLYE